MGIEAQHPRFSWKIVSSERDVNQTAYRIIVSDNLKDIQGLKSNCWDTGKRESASTFNIFYEGESLRSACNYFWRACSYINEKEVWSDAATFRTGLLDQKDWSASWIGANEDTGDASPMFRKSFSIEKKIKAAYVYASAAGVYELYLNGKKLGDEVLNPSISDYRRTCLYSVFDATRQFRSGENTFGVVIGNGAYNLHNVNGRHAWANIPPIGTPRFIVQAIITYEDGSEGIISTDGDWKYDMSPITFNHLSGGEDYDCAKEQKGWNDAGFDDSRWKKAAIAESPGGVLRWQAVPIRVTETLTPVAQTNPAEGVYIFDLGQNIAGWWKIIVRGEAGRTVRVRGSETLNDMLFPKNLQDGDTMSTKFGYHKSVWMDYTLRGDRDAAEEYEPRFFYSGFRYIEVTTADRRPVEEIRVLGRVVRSDIEYEGEWTSSDTLMNRIYNAAIWSIKGNNVSYPTDCPQREKGGYGGDGQVIAEATMLNFHTPAYYYKWINDMRDAQEPNGKIPNTIPPIVGGMGGGVAWGSAYILIPWWMYQRYDDAGILEEHYPAMKRYINYLRDLARSDDDPQEEYIINNFGGYWYSLGEWLAPGQSDCPNHAVVNTFYYYYDTKLMSKIAARLGHDEDARQFSDLCDTIKTEFNRKFFSPQTCIYGTDSVPFQTYQLLALVGDLVPDEHREGVVKTIVDDIKSRSNHLNTGIIGTKYLWPVLSDYGYDDLLYTVATQKTYPGYGYFIENNSTTLLEQWDAQNSHNHQMFGTIIEYMQEYLAGIRRAENGYRRILLAPVMPDGLTHVQASIRTMPGKIASAWTKNADGSYDYRADIPANTSATVLLPLLGSTSPTLLEGGKPVWKDNTFTNNVEGIKEAYISDKCLKLLLASGNYHFHLSSK
jgi:alpha-L-rhamnosidase